MYDRQDIAGKSPEDKMVRIGCKGTASSRKFPVNGYYEYSPFDEKPTQPVLDVVAS